MTECTCVGCSSCQENAVSKDGWKIRDVRRNENPRVMWHRGSKAGSDSEKGRETKLAELSITSHFVSTEDRHG